MSWTQTRLIAFYCITPHTKKIKKPIDLFPFEWEKGSLRHSGYDEEQRKEIEAFAKDIWKIKPDGTSSRADHTTGEKVTPEQLSRIIDGDKKVRSRGL